MVLIDNHHSARFIIRFCFKVCVLSLSKVCKTSATTLSWKCPGHGTTAGRGARASAPTWPFSTRAKNSVFSWNTSIFHVSFRSRVFAVHLIAYLLFSLFLSLYQSLLCHSRCRVNGHSNLWVDGWFWSRFLSTELEIPDNFSFFVGGTDRGDEGVWYWVDGSPVKMGVPLWGQVIIADFMNTCEHRHVHKRTYTHISA